MARAITLVESTKKEDFDLAQNILQAIMPKTGKSVRIGITGVPGVGKSTFIEAFGNHLVSLNFNVAVLAVDPSSPYTGGSILGDKTRMQELSKHDRVFIRPSPTGGTLGGVSRKTRESMLLCEAAGYDVILVETVGVGQSEYEVASMVDFFLLLMLPNAGDALQGIKRGILELADMLLVNKAEGEYMNQAKMAANEYKNALHFARPRYDGYQVDVRLCSALTGDGIPESWEAISTYIDCLKNDGHFNLNRKKQLLQWTRRLTEELLLQSFWNDENTKKSWAISKAEIQEGKSTPLKSGKKLVDGFGK